MYSKGYRRMQSMILLYCEWNRFLKDFCADPINDKFKSKLKAAAILWRIVRDSDQPKMYSHTLVQDHLKQLEKL